MLFARFDSNGLIHSFVPCLCFFLLMLNVPFALAAPPNDNFVDAIAITGNTGTTSGNNIGATSEAGEPDYQDATFADTTPDKTVWFKWKAPADGIYYFNTFGSITTSVSELDTILAVYTGTALNDLVWVEGNDDFSPTLLQSRLSFTAQAGTIYFISVGGWGDGVGAQEGYISLNWSPAAPANDDFALATVITGESGTIATTNINATPQANEPNHIGSPPTPAYSSIWFSWTAPADGLYIFNTAGSNFNTTMAVYTGATLDTVVKVEENDDAGTKNKQSMISFQAFSGTTYHIAVDGYNGIQGNVTLNWQPLPSLPANDEFASATVISGKSGSTEAYTFLATPEAGEPGHAADPNAPYKSIWFAWTAPYTGKAIFDTFGSDFDTTMAAYTGPSVDSLTQLAVNDDAGLQLQSRIIFSVSRGNTYYIAVDGYQGTEGNVTLNWKKQFPWATLISVISRGARP